MAERGSPRASYTASFKLRVVAYAVDKGNRAAGKQFNVDESCVRRWRSQREKLLKTPRNKRAQRGRSAAFPELEKEVAEWITEKRKAGTACPQTLFALKLNQSPKSWDCPNNLRPLNAGATASWIDLASPSEGE